MIRDTRWKLRVGDEKAERVFEAFRLALRDSPFTVTGIAQLVGVDRTTVSSWLHGKTDPELAQMIAVLEALREELTKALEGIDRGTEVLHWTYVTAESHERLSKRASEESMAALIEASKALDAALEDAGVGKRRR